jgi:hypothetical protein
MGPGGLRGRPLGSSQGFFLVMANACFIEDASDSILPRMVFLYEIHTLSLSTEVDHPDRFSIPLWSR